MSQEAQDQPTNQEDSRLGLSDGSTDHAGRFRLAIVMPNGYGMDISWQDQNSLEEVLRLVVVCMDEESGIDNAIKTVVDKILDADSP